MKCDALRNLLTLSYTRKSQVFTDLEGVLRNLETSYDANIRALSTEVLQKLSASQEIDDDVQQHQGGPNKRDESQELRREDTNMNSNKEVDFQENQGGPITDIERYDLPREDTELNLTINEEIGVQRSHTEDGETEDTEPKQLRRWGRSQDLQGKKHLRSQAVGLRWGMKKPRTVPHEY